jgi:hypothetical protein
MKSLTSLTLALALAITPVLSLSAQEIGGSTSSIAAIVAREGARLAAQPQTELDGAAWARVRRLAHGTRTVVIMRSAQVVRGALVAADETSLTIAVDSADVRRADRTDVVEIRREPGWAGRHPGLIGALTGAAAGIALVAVGFQTSGNGYQCNLECGLIPASFAGGAGVGAGLGSAVGAVIGASIHSKREQIIYRAQ